MKLYDINQELQTVQTMLEEWALDHDGDITDFPLSENLAGVEMDRENKLLSIACVIKGYEAEAEAFASEIKKLADRKKSAQSKADSLLAWLEMNVTIGEKLADSRAVISWRKSEVVNIICEPELLPEKYQRVKVEADKAAIKESLKNGDFVVGCALESRQNMQVK